EPDPRHADARRPAAHPQAVAGWADRHGGNGVVADPHFRPGHRPAAAHRPARDTGGGLMSTPAQAAQLLETALRTVDGLRVYRDRGAAVDPPAAIVGLPQLGW